MAANLTVNVGNIATETEEKQIKEFFSFCGKITSLTVTPDASGKTKSATVTFEKETAAKTAQLLNNTQLQGSQISVTSAGGLSDDGIPHATNDTRDSDEITQEEKPRSRILAEYMAHGYVIGDVALQRALELDQKHGVTNRFVTTLNKLESKYHTTDRAKAADQSYSISARASSLFSGINSYFEKASNTPTGQKLVQFYTDSSRQVQDVHAEARRLADLKTEEHGSAYKAAGLEKVFGKEKPAGEAPANPAATTDSSSTTPAPATTESTPLTATQAAPPKTTGDEKYA